MENKRPSILEANYLYMLVALLLITIGGFFQYKNIYTGVFITEYIIILLPMLVFVLLRKYGFKDVFKLNTISLEEAIISILIVVFSYPIALFFNYITIVLISIFGELRQSPLPVPENSFMYLKGLFLFALAPGICEEVMFRGIMYKAYEKIGIKKAIVITGIMFGVFHFDLQNLLAPTFLGILFAYMVYKTDSLYTSIIGHTANNAIALTLLRLAGNQEVEAEVLAASQTTQTFIGTLISLGIISVFLSLVVSYLLNKLSKASEKRKGQSRESEVFTKEKITALHITPLMVVGAIFIFSVFKYFQSIMSL